MTKNDFDPNTKKWTFDSAQKMYSTFDNNDQKMVSTRQKMISTPQKWFRPSRKS